MEEGFTDESMSLESDMVDEGLVIDAGLTEKCRTLSQRSRTRA